MFIGQNGAQPVRLSGSTQNDTTKRSPGQESALGFLYMMKAYHGPTSTSRNLRGAQFVYLYTIISPTKFFIAIMSKQPNTSDFFSLGNAKKL